MENIETGSNFVKNEITMKKLPKVDGEQLKLNPFSQDLVIKATKRISPTAKIKDEKGEWVPASSLVDKAKATKIYTSALFRDKALNLTAGGLRLFVYIVYEMDGPQDWMQILPEQYISKGNSSKSSYRRAVEELIDEGYISPTKFKYVYWINPILMFSGSRVGKYPDKVIVTNEHTW